MSTCTIKGQSVVGNEHIQLGIEWTMYKREGIRQDNKRKKESRCMLLEAPVGVRRMNRLTHTLHTFPTVSNRQGHTITPS